MTELALGCGHKIKGSRPRRGRRHSPRGRARVFRGTYCTFGNCGRMRKSSWNRNEHWMVASEPRERATAAGESGRHRNKFVNSMRVLVSPSTSTPSQCISDDCYVGSCASTQIIARSRKEMPQWSDSGKPAGVGCGNTKMSSGIRRERLKRNQLCHQLNQRPVEFPLKEKAEDSKRRRSGRLL